MFKVNGKDIKITLLTLFDVLNINIERISQFFLVFILLTLDMYLFVNLLL